MVLQQDLLSLVNGSFSIIETFAIAVILIVIFNFLTRSIKRRLLKKAKTKNQISNIKILARILNVSFIIIVILFAFFTYIGSLTGFGVVFGLFTAALGLALQKPITGVAAWIMVVVKRPFRVGDRISIGDIKGDVYDISLTHIYIDEVGGLTEGDEHSGRNVAVPNHLLFENNIINYTLLDDYVIGEANVTIGYGSNLNKAIELVRKATAKHAGKHTEKAKKEIKIAVSLEGKGIRITSRFFAPIRAMSQVSSDITLEIYNSLKNQKGIRFFA